jgi:hypothetical protein
MVHLGSGAYRNCELIVVGASSRQPRHHFAPTLGTKERVRCKFNKKDRLFFETEGLDAVIRQHGSAGAEATFDWLVRQRA